MMTLTCNGFRIYVLKKPAPDAQSEVRRKILSISSMAADKQHRLVETHHSE